jgi:mannosyltransferase
VKIRNINILFALLAIITAWIPQLPTALFVDEAATHWMIRDGWYEALHRSLLIPGQSSLYAVLLSFWSRLFGTSEVALRIPSVIAGALVCVLLHIFSYLRRSPGIKLASALIILAPTFAFASTLARPYGLGLFFSVAAIVIAQFGMERSIRMLIYISGVVASLSIYCHITFLAVVPALLLVIFQSSHGIAAKKEAGRLLLTVALCAAPVLLHHFNLKESSIKEVAVIHEIPSAIAVFWYLNSVPIALVCGWLIAIKLCVSRKERMLNPGYGRDLSFGLVLYLSSKFLALVAAIAINPTLMLARYCALSTIGETIVAASLVTAIAQPLLRRVLTIIFAVSAILPWLFVTPPDTAWLPVVTETKRYVNSEGCDVFAEVGFAESRHVSLLTREPERSFIRAPLEYYHLLPATLLPIYAQSAEEREYLSHNAFSEIEKNSCHILLTWRPQDPALESTGHGAFMAEMQRRGCVKQAQRSAGLVTMSMWSCR